MIAFQSQLKGKHKTAGFTLLEAAVYLTILGLFTAMLMEGYRDSRNQKIMNENEMKRYTLRKVIGNFVAENQRLPCPADPSLPRSHPDAGAETDFCQDSVTAGSFGSCGPYDPVCKSESERDAKWPDEFSLPDADEDPDPIVKGALPYKALGITFDDTIDAWGGQMSYTVSSHMTHQSRFNYDAGVLGHQVLVPIDDEWEFREARRARTSGGGSTEKSFLFAIVSHGPDRKGAYNYSGNLIAPCIGSHLDVENCNGTSQFIYADWETPIISHGDNDDFFDDGFTIFTVNQDSDKWQYASITEMNNKSGGKVGIGLSEPDLPEAPLHIIGNLKGSNGFANDFCSSAGNCFDPVIIGGSDSVALSCEDSLLKGISDANVRCANNIDTVGIVPHTCPEDSYVVGFETDGSIICEE